jgi:autophagy-related protein 5
VLGRPPSTDPAGAPNLDGAYSVRSVPVRIYLPDGPVIQELVPPMLEEGLYLLFLSEIIAAAFAHEYS